MTAASAEILLLGGGYTLERVAALLPRHSFVITSRNFEKVRAWQQKGWQACILDVNQPETIAGALAQYPNLTVLVDSVPPDRLAKDHVQSAIDRGKAFKQSKIQRAIYLSTTGVFGVEDGSIVNENTPANPKHESGRARLAHETAYLELIPNTIVLRLPAIYGPGRGTGHALKAERYPFIEDGKRWSNRIHVEDLARIIAALLDQNPSERLFCVSDGTPALSSDVVAYYCQTFNLPQPESITLDEAKARGMHSVLSNQQIDSNLLYKTLKLKPKYPSFREGALSEMQVSK